MEVAGVFTWTPTVGQAGTYYIVAVVSDGTLSDTSTAVVEVGQVGIDEELGIPEKYEISQNYPNPFNPMTTIKYELPKESFVTIAIYDLMGNKVCDLVNQNQNAGYRHGS